MLFIHLFFVLTQILFYYYSRIYICRCVIIEESSPSIETIFATYECEVCSCIFTTKKDFLLHHIGKSENMFVCCKCNEKFKLSDKLYEHYEEHKNENIYIYEEEVTIDLDETIEFEHEYTENVEAVMNIPDNDCTNEVYILDDTQCANEVIIEEEEDDDEEELLERTTSSTKSNDNYTIVQMEHGYMLPSVFKGQLESRPRQKKKDIVVQEPNETSFIKIEPTTSKMVQQKGRIQSRRRHEIPDFSASDYVQLKPNEDVDMPHFKCLRCEQLFINKFVFFRHIEKGKCFINRCDACMATFDKNSDFYDHYIENHTDRAICNFCFRTFMYEKNVKEHMLRHLDQFRHRCEECNKGFYTIREYRNHYKNRHMGIRHQCDVCGRSFADEYYFKRHMTTHTDVVVNIDGNINPVLNFT